MFIIFEGLLLKQIKKIFGRWEPDFNGNLQLPDSTVMPNQSNSPQTTEPTEPTQDTDNSNSPSEEVSEMPLRQSSRIQNRPKYLQDCDQKVV